MEDITNNANMDNGQGSSAADPAQGESQTDEIGTKVTEQEDADKEHTEGMLGGAQEENKEQDTGGAEGMLGGAGQDKTDSDEGTEEKQAEKPDETKVPEAYELKFPEGFVLDKETLDAVTPTLKELGASNEQVQKLSDEVCKLVAKNNDAQMQAVRDNCEKFEREIKADPEIGGARYEQSRNLAAQAVKKLLNKDEAQDLITMLDETGISYYPAFFKLLRNMGERLSEDKLVAGSGTAGTMTEDERAKAHWPNSI